MERHPARDRCGRNAARVVHRAGAGHPGRRRDRGPRGRADPDLRRVRGPGAPAGAAPGGGRGAAGKPGRTGHATVDGPRCRSLRGARGRWRLRPAGPRPAHRAHRIRAGDRAAGVRIDHHPRRFRVRGADAERRRTGPVGLLGYAADRRGTTRHTAAVASGVRDLHLRLHRPSQGRGGAPCGRREPDPLDHRRIRHRRAGRGAVQDARHLRRVGVGIVRALGGRWPDGRGEPRRASRSAVPGRRDRRRAGDDDLVRAVDADRVRRRRRGAGIRFAARRGCRSGGDLVAARAADRR
ncbi:hypothetical protein NRB56_76240 [Nocardia sp. RB56]|uniref:Uncharacterized protein n=1 Tax=Nocardia aurantia TaxID=2585199 RepID=A0A7K0E1N9_9NOCA|nr:hypothetical protein [Nocardia aurantia]